MKKYLVTIDNEETHDDFIQWVLNHEDISIQKYKDENTNDSGNVTSIKDQIIKLFKDEGFEYEGGYLGGYLAKCCKPYDGRYMTLVSIIFKEDDRYDIKYYEKENDWGYIKVYKDMGCGSYGGSKSVQMDQEWFRSLPSFCEKYNDNIKPLIEMENRKFLNDFLNFK